MRPSSLAVRGGFRMRAHIIGVSVSDTASDTSTAIDSVMPNSRKKRPTMPPIKTIGMNTATSDRLIDSTVKPTSRAPKRAAAKRDMPASMWRVMFSSTTIASSTTKPVATVKAMSDKLSMLNPRRYMMPNVPINDTGTAIEGMSVARPLRRNRNTTRMTRHEAIMSVRSMSAREARIVVERSTATPISIAGEIEALSSGMSASTRSTVSMMLALGAR